MTYPLYQVNMPAALSLQESADLAARVASLTSAGMPLESGLLALADELPSQQSVLRNLAARLSRGEPFDRASQAADSRLPATLRGLVSAGLRSGRLPQVLEEYASLMRRQQTFQRQASLVLIYPALLSCIMAALMVGFRLFLVSDFASIFRDFGTKMPGLTEFVLDAAPGMMWGSLVLAAALSIAAAVPIFLVRVWPFSSLIEFLPVIGSILQYRRLAAATELLAILLENNVPAPEALELVAAANDSPRIASDLRASADKVRQGSALDQALGATGLPRRLTTLVAWGQTTENVPESLRAAAESFESHLQSRRHFLKVIIAPIFFVLITGVTGMIILALFLPLLQLITALSAW